MGYSKILVGYDCSDAANRALSDAYELVDHGLADGLVIATVTDLARTGDPAFNAAARAAGVLLTSICDEEEALDNLQRNVAAKIVGHEDVTSLRVAFGKPVARFQLNSLKFCHMAIKLDSMRNMLYEAAWNADTNLGGDVDAGQAAMCKYFCANASFEVVDDAMQVMGGIAVASEHRINRIWRDLRVDRVSGGTDEMMILTASKNAIKAYRQ